MNFTIFLLIIFTLVYIIQSCIFNLVLLNRSKRIKNLIKKQKGGSALDLSWLNLYLLLFILFYLLIFTYLGLTPEAITNETSSSIQDIFSNSQTINNPVAKDLVISSYPIKAPIESGELLQIKPMLVDILSQNLQLNMIILYLICMVLFILTCKFVLSEKTTSSFLRGVLSLPLGYYLHYILSYIVIGWQKSSILWLYFIIFSLLIFNLTSCYSIYACLIILES